MTLPPGYDRRLTAANGRVAAQELAGRIRAQRYVQPDPARIAPPVADLLDAPAPDGRRDRQLLTGWAVEVFERRDGYAFVRSLRDGYVGYIAERALAGPEQATHRVCARTTHVYPRPDLKSRECLSLSFGSEVAVTGGDADFVATRHGWIPAPHVAPLDRLFDDPVTVAGLFLGVPYLWGGNSGFGIDCSGLVQAALLACGHACPGDTDMQAGAVGRALAGGTPPERGDLLFWQGHVAMVTDAQTLIHANAGHMAVSREPIAAAIARIAGRGEGPVTAHRRL